MGAENNLSSSAPPGYTGTSFVPLTTFITWLRWFLSLSLCLSKDKPALNSGTFYKTAIGGFWVPLIQGQFCRKSPRLDAVHLVKCREKKKKARQHRGSGHRNSKRISNVALSAEIFVLWKKNAFRNPSRSHLYIKTSLVKGHLLFSINGILIDTFTFLSVRFSRIQNDWRPRILLWKWP